MTPRRSVVADDTAAATPRTASRFFREARRSGSDLGTLSSLTTPERHPAVPISAHFRGSNPGTPRALSQTMTTTNTSASLCDLALDAVANTWLRCAVDHHRTGDLASLTHALRNTTCAGIRKAITACNVVRDGAVAIKAPVARAEAIAKLYDLAGQIRAHGYVHA